MADVGRPTIYNEKLITEFCSRIASGRSLRDVCRDKDMPHITTIQDWRNKYPEFSSQYDKATDERADNIFEDTLQIVDNVELDKDAIAKARLQMDARKWFLSKLKPKRFGDKVEPIEVDDDTGEITINVRRVGKDAN